MEFAWLPSYRSAWVVNTLPMDDYLAGLVEQNDDIPWEALRASAIAFRTYAYTVRGPRRARNALFDMAASTRHTPTLYTRDQVYHGYARELSGTRLRDAVHDTRGCVLTYEGSTIHAVYFSRADGRTRSWHEEWGGPIKPWAVAVDDPYSRGQTLLGHGIGLPLRSANAMAAAGANGEQILASYYTGVDFEHVY
jgi:SpoIID/LytB domain protein